MSQNYVYNLFSYFTFPYSSPFPTKFRWNRSKRFTFTLSRIALRENPQFECPPFLRRVFVARPALRCCLSLGLKRRRAFSLVWRAGACVTYVTLSVLHSFYPLFRAQVLCGCTVSSLRFRGFNPAFPLFLFVVFSAINRFLRISLFFLVHTAYLLSSRYRRWHMG